MIVPRLPPRLRGLLALVPEDGAVADVGAGHGALAVHLAAAGRRVIATEVAAGPFAELGANLRRWGAEERVEVRRGPGLEPLADGEVAGLVVAGMGGRRLLGIAAAAGDKGVGWLCLQCVQGAALVEPWLAERGWRVLARARPEQGRHRYPTWLAGSPGSV